MLGLVLFEEISLDRVFKCFDIPVLNVESRKGNNIKINKIKTPFLQTRMIIINLSKSDQQFPGTNCSYQRPRGLTVS